MTHPTRDRLVLRASCVIVLSLAICPPASGQGIDLGSANACLANVPSAAFTRVPVYLEAGAASVHREILPAADVLASMAARLVRSSLEAAGDSLVAGEALLHWRDLDAEVEVVVHRDGRFTWSAPAAVAVSDTTHRAGNAVLAQALLALRDAGARPAWPATASADSLVFTLSYTGPIASRSGEVTPFTARYAVPLFSMERPWAEQVVMQRAPRVAYPSRSRSGSAEGKVILEFIVDPAGNIDAATIEEEWPSDRPRLTGELGMHYRAFLAAAKRSLGDARFTPAVVGGCAVRQRVQLPFEFSFVR